MIKLEQTVTRFNKDYELTITEWNQCLLFANQQIKQSLNHYNRIGTKSKEDTIYDIAIGKAAEIAAFILLKPHLSSIIYPDFNIYAIKNKDYEPDIRNSKGTINFHVKCCISNPQSPSWLFSKNDPCVMNANNPNNIALLFVVKINLNDYSKMNNNVMKAGHNKNFNLTPTMTLLYGVDLEVFNQWEQCYSPKHRQNKVAIYADTLNRVR